MGKYLCAVLALMLCLSVMSYGAIATRAEEGEAWSKDVEATVLPAESVGDGKGEDWAAKSGKSTARVKMSASMAMGVGQKSTLVAKALDADGAETGDALTWTADKSCVRIDGTTGLLEAVRMGSATVKATAPNGVYATCEVKVVSAPAAIRMNVSALSVGVNETSSALVVRLVPPNGAKSCASEIQWTSSNASVATVSARTGVITGKKAGTAVITATTHNNLSVSAKVTVKSAPTELKLSTRDLKLGVGMTSRLTATVNGGISSTGLTWTSDKTSVATVDENGNVTGIGKGSATVTVKTYNNKSLTCKVTVGGAPAKLTLAQSAIHLVVGQRAALSPSVLDADNAATLAAYTYTILVQSEDPDCLTISEGGAITAVQKGTAIVGVETHNGLSAQCRVSIAAAPEEIALGVAKLTIGVKEAVGAPEVRLIPEDSETVITWQSSDASVAKVNASTGAITGVKAGSATVTAQTHNGKKATVSVTVKAAPTSAKVNPTTATLSPGMKLQLSPAYNSGAAGGVTWSGGNAQVATVDALGVVTATGVGTATISMRSYNNLTANCKITVLEPPFDITLSDTSISLIEGQTHTLSAEVRDVSDAPTVADYSYRVYSSSTDPACVAVDAFTGVITALKRGSAVIQVNTQNGLEGYCTVNVRAAPEDIQVTPATLSMGLNETYNGFDVRLIPHAGETQAEAVLTWRSSNASIVKVDAATGAIKGIKAGSATIYVKTHNNIEKSVKVNVLSAPTSMKLSPDPLRMRVGDVGKPTASFNSGAASANITYASSDANVVRITSDGSLKGVSKGKAVITGTTFNGKTATTDVEVLGAPDQVFATEKLSLAVGMSRTLETSVIDLDGKATFANYTFTAVDDTGSVTVDANGVVTAVKAGKAYVRVKADNGVSTHVSIQDGSRVDTVCEVTVSAAPARVELPQSIELDVGQQRKLEPVLYTADGKVTRVGDYEMKIAGSAATLTADGIVTGARIGWAMVTVTTYNDIVATCKVYVIGKRYRLFTACSYADPSVRGGLYFTEHNIKSMKKVFGETTVEGVKYELLGNLVNPSKSTLVSSLKNSFADSVYTDVNIIYLCSHGYNYIDVDVETYRKAHNDEYPPTHYGLQLPGYTNWASAKQYYITAEEIYSAISAINGKVILILDSCYSGEFITNMKSKLEAENGRISVLTAASNTKASYNNVKDKSRAFDFFTYYLLMGIGCDEYNNTFVDSFNADANGDGKVTLNEFFSYGRSEVLANLPSFADKSWFHGDASQTPRYYAGKNGSIVIYTKTGP